MKSTFAAAAKKLQPELVEIRRHLHAHPEPGANQPESAAYLAGLFSGMDVEVKCGANHIGLIVDIHGKYPGPTTALRADMDALFMQETDSREHLPNIFGFSSKKGNAMHGCGHDAHSAILFGAGKLIYENREKLKGNVRLLFQPGEEGHFGGRRMVEAGYLDDVDKVFAFHSYPHLKVGQVAYRKGGICAAIDVVNVVVTGIGGHGAHQESSSDQVLAVARIINDLQSVVSRRISALHQVVISICHINAGSRTAYSVMPASAEFTGSIRTFDREIRREVKQMFHDLCLSAAKTVHPECKVEISYEEKYPVTYNDPAVVERLNGILPAFIATENLFTDYRPLLVSEDFSYMLERVPGAMMLLGVTSPDKDMEKIPFLHNPDFDIDENALWFGAQVFANIVFRDLE